MTLCRIFKNAVYLSLLSIIIMLCAVSVQVHGCEKSSDSESQRMGELESIQDINER